MSNPILYYSTNTRLVFDITLRLLSGEFRVWCSPTYDSRTLGKYVLGASTPPSSNPAELYHRYKEAVRRGDRHNPDIDRIRDTLRKLALDFHQRRLITRDVQQEIVYLARNSGFEAFNPLVYVLPANLVQDRVSLVSPDKRASREPEYIVENLKRQEFDVIEP